MVHQYQLNGFNIVLDSCSGAVHVVDEVAYDLIALYPTQSKEEIIETLAQKYPEVTRDELAQCHEDVTYLVESKQLYTEDTFEPMAGTFK